MEHVLKSLTQVKAAILILKCSVMRKMHTFVAFHFYVCFTFILKLLKVFCCIIMYLMIVFCNVTLDPQSN